MTDDYTEQPAAPAEPEGDLRAQLEQCRAQFAELVEKTTELEGDYNDLIAEVKATLDAAGNASDPRPILAALRAKLG